MGKGGRAANANSTVIKSNKKRLEDGSDGHHGWWKSSYDPTDPNAPTLPSKGEIKAVIPEKCFERSYRQSIWYVVRDTVMAMAVVYVARTYLSTEMPQTNANTGGADAASMSSQSTSLMTWFTWIIGWNIYAFSMGTVIMGHWVLAHECGHGAFSPSQTFNDIMGFIMHQALLVPYFAWQYSHAKHHRRTNHLTDGESHVPSTGSEYGLVTVVHGNNPNNGNNGNDSTTIKRTGNYSALHETMGDGAFAAFEVFTHVVLGWPLYLLGVASTGRLANDGTFLAEGEIIDHFRPSSKMFPMKIRVKIMLSTVTIIASLGLLTILSLEYGFLPVFLWYTAPYLWVNFWLVTYTWLQHTDPSVPQYGPNEWTWVKGTLSTIDRPYGIFDYFHHKIGSTHVAHHLFHTIPFYHADDATDAIRSFLEPKGLYNYDPNPWYRVMWRIAHTCHYVEDLNGIQYFKSFDDVPLSSSSSSSSSSTGKKKAE